MTTAPIAQQPTYVSPSRTEVRPLSNDYAANETSAPQAALEVDRFEWPPASEVLMHHAAADLDAVVALIADQAANGSQAIAVLSSDDGEGSTTVAMCLARKLASRAGRVCLVDGDVYRPQLAESLGLDPARGLEAVLAAEATLSEVLIESLEDRLTLLPLSTPLTADVIARAKLRQKVTFGELRDRFEVVLVDAGSVGMPAARRPSLLEGGSIDAAILIGRQHADRLAWQRGRRALEQWNVPCLGAIENRCEM